MAADEKNANAMYMMDLCYRSKGDDSKTLEMLEKAFIINPSLNSRQ